MWLDDVSIMFQDFFNELINIFHLFTYDNGIITYCREILVLKPSDRSICTTCIRKDSKLVIPVYFTYATFYLSEF